jgi:hypothetical protein
MTSTSITILTPQKADERYPRKDPETGQLSPEAIPDDGVVAIYRRADGTPYINVREA